MSSQVKLKYQLEDCIEVNKIHPGTFMVPNIEEVNKLRKGDFVYLVFKNNKDEGERMWVKITKVINSQTISFEGELANEPILIKEIKEGEAVNFEGRHIANFSTKEEQKRIIDEYNKTGIIPGNISAASTKDTVEIINDFVKLQEEYQDKIKLIYELNEDDLIFFKHDSIAFEGLANDKNEDLDNLSELYKMYLSLMFMIVTPQIIRNFDEGNYFTGNEYSVYYLKTTTLLKKSLKIFERIAETHLSLLEELRDFHSSEEAVNVPSEDLSEYFASFISESMECLFSINKVTGEN